MKLTSSKDSIDITVEDGDNPMEILEIATAIARSSVQQATGLFDTREMVFVQLTDDALACVTR